MLQHIIALLLLLLTPFCVSGESTAVGIPVAGMGETDQVGTVLGGSHDGYILMYLPLDGGTPAAAPTYGVDDGGTFGTVSTTHPATVTGGYMQMWLYFAPNETPAVESEMTLRFKDLDLEGANDPWILFESVEITTGGETVLVDEITDPEASGNSYFQTITLDLVDLGVTTTEEMWARLLFKTTIQQPNNYRYLRNTAEKLLATLRTVAVPEPATYALLGIGLSLVALRRRSILA